jgi:hypothetical protein
MLPDFVHFDANTFLGENLGEFLEIRCDIVFFA